MREDWIEIELGKICSVNMGQSPPSSTYNKEGDGMPFFQGKAEFTELHPVVEKWCTAPKKTAKTGDILMSVRAPVGSTNIANIDCAIGRGLAAITYPFGYRYLWYFLKLIERKLDDQGTGTTFKAISGSVLKSQIVPIAPLPEQRAIVAKIEQLFSELDNGIDNLKAAKDKLEIYRQAVLKKAFEGELTKEWREQNPYSEKDLVELLEYIEDFNANKSGQDIPRRLPPIDLSDLHGLPYGWFWQESHKICSSVRDGTHDTPKYVDEGVPLVTSKNLKSGEIDMDNVDLISESDHEEICRRSAVDENDILYGMIGTIGNPVIVKETNAFSIKNVGLFKKNERLLVPKYFQYYLSSWVVEHIMRQKELIRGTTQKFVALGGLRVLPIPLPSKNEQEQVIYEIESRLSVCDNILANIEEGLEKSEALRQSILKQAFEGKLLSEEELEACRKETDWEPAEQLLERIKNRNKVESKKVSYA
ncbi:MAG: restriction endonuclease subunit S [Synergistaceae bacterium]|jgi:type I restriction enzyme S subunit|nr:restriction endonuclease subunit S [Synergistaceae bacterium]